MSFDTLEKSGFGAQPYELYLFQGTGISFALTSAESSITYLGQQYAPSTITRSEAEQSNEVVSGQIKVYIPKDHPLAVMLIPYLPSSPIAITVFGSHYSDSETVVLFTGVIASARLTDQCELTCNSAQYLLQRKIPQQLYQAPCSHIFGDAGCGADLASHTYDGAITAIDSTGTILTIPAFASLPDPLKAGYLKFGNDYRMIVDHSGATVTLISAIPGLAIGANVRGTAGCNLDFSACAHYRRTVSFLGFDLIPTVNPFDG
ncbi:MAG: baseplate hub protein, partial [Candidatus Acidiferrales bacterium]